VEVSHEDRVISEEDFHEWMQHPITQAYFREVNQKIKDLILSFKDGATVNKDNADYTVQETNKIIGKIEGLQEILDIELEKE